MNGTISAALVVIDMQNCFRDRTGQWAVPRYDEIVPVIEALQHTLDGPTVYTKFVAGNNKPGSWEAYYRRWDQMCLPQGAPEWDISMDVPPGSETICAPTFSKWGPKLETLIPLGGELILTGVATDCCVLSTALGAVDAGRYVTVVADACAAVSDEAQQQTLALLALLSPMCRVLTSAEVLTRGGNETAADLRNKGLTLSRPE